MEEDVILDPKVGFWFVRHQVAPRLSSLRKIDGFPAMASLTRECLEHPISVRNTNPKIIDNSLYLLSWH